MSAFSKFALIDSQYVVPVLNGHFIEEYSDLAAKCILEHIVQRASDTKIFMDITNEDGYFRLRGIGNRFIYWIRHTTFLIILRTISV